MTPNSPQAQALQSPAGAPGSPWSRLAGPALLACAIVLAVLIVNPFREILTEDDGWAYARTVQHLLATGRYELDAWSAANMPVQVYLAAALARLTGYSLIELRLITLAFLILAVVSFYKLLRELGWTAGRAGVLGLALLCMPLVPMLGFTFMSDIQFLGWFLVALWLYVRGLRRASISSVLIASLAAAFAVGTRQFGLALIAGLLPAWLIARRKSAAKPALLIAGLLLPLLAAGLQFRMGLWTPTFTQSYRLYEQHQFLAEPLPRLVREVLWRALVLLQYIGIGIVPLLPLALARARGRPHGSHFARLLPVALVLLAMLIALHVSSPLTARPQPYNRLWSPLELYWLLPTQFWGRPLLLRSFDLLGLFGAGLLVWMAVGALRPPARHLSPELVFLTATATTLLVLQLSYVQFNDTYVVPFLPFALLLATAGDARTITRSWPWATSALLCLAMLIFTTLLMRHEYAAQETRWKAAESLFQQGVPAIRIAGSLHWAEYHGAFDDWIRAGAPGFNPGHAPLSSSHDELHDPFYAWLDCRNRQAAFRPIP